MKRLILGVTGIRSEYDIMSSVFNAIDCHSTLDLKLVVTGAHLSDAYGHTIDEIICINCDEHQKVSNKCTKCDTQFGKYFCNISNSFFFFCIFNNFKWYIWFKYILIWISNNYISI